MQQSVCGTLAQSFIKPGAESGRNCALQKLHSTMQQGCSAPRAMFHQTRCSSGQACATAKKIQPPNPTRLHTGKSIWAILLELWQRCNLGHRGMLYLIRERYDLRGRILVGLPPVPFPLSISLARALVGLLQLFFHVRNLCFSSIGPVAGLCCVESRAGRSAEPRS